MAAAGILLIQIPVEPLTMTTLLLRPNAALAAEDTDRNLQIQLVMAATGTYQTQCGAVTLMITISQLQSFAQPAGTPMLSFKESSNHIQWLTYREEHSHFPLLVPRKSH